MWVRRTRSIAVSNAALTSGEDPRRRGDDLGRHARAGAGFRRSARRRPAPPPRPLADVVQQRLHHRLRGLHVEAGALQPDGGGIRPATQIFDPHHGAIVPRLRDRPGWVSHGPHARRNTGDTPAAEGGRRLRGPPLPRGSQSRLLRRRGAAALGVDPGIVFKTLVAQVDGGPVLTLVPTDAQLDLKALAAALGRPGAAGRAGAGRTSHRLRGGGISALGTRRPLPTVADESLAAVPTVYLSAGKRGLQVSLSSADYCASPRRASPPSPGAADTDSESPSAAGSRHPDPGDREDCGHQRRPPHQHRQLCIVSPERTTTPSARPLAVSSVAVMSCPTRTATKPAATPPSSSPMSEAHRPPAHADRPPQRQQQPCERQQPAEHQVGDEVPSGWGSTRTSSPPDTRNSTRGASADHSSPTTNPPPPDDDPATGGSPRLPATPVGCGRNGRLHLRLRAHAAATQSAPAAPSGRRTAPATGSPEDGRAAARCGAGTV